MERLRALAVLARKGTISAPEKAEYRSIMSAITPEAQDFAFDELVEISMTWLGFYFMARLGAEAAASAS